MKSKEKVKLEREVAYRMWETTHLQSKDMDEAYYLGVLTALEWVLEYYEDQYIPMYAGLLTHD